MHEHKLIDIIGITPDNIENSKRIWSQFSSMWSKLQNPEKSIRGRKNGVTHKTKGYIARTIEENLSKQVEKFDLYKSKLEKLYSISNNYINDNSDPWNNLKEVENQILKLNEFRATFHFDNEISVLFEGENKCAYLDSELIMSKLAILREQLQFLGDKNTPSIFLTIPFDDSTQPAPDLVERDIKEHLDSYENEFLESRNYRLQCWVRYAQKFHSHFVSIQIIGDEIGKKDCSIVYNDVCDYLMDLSMRYDYASYEDGADGSNNQGKTRRNNTTKEFGATSSNVIRLIDKKDGDDE